MGGDCNRDLTGAVVFGSLEAETGFVYRFDWVFGNEKWLRIASSYPAGT